MEQTIGKYQVKRLIGTGGMADVYEVESLGPGGFTKQLCIKKIRKELAARQDFVTLFQTEARIISRLQHSNIVQVFEFNRDDKTGDLFLVMEYVEGLDLNTILKQASDLGLQVPLDFAVYVLESLLSALQHAHSLKTKDALTPVIHRDISPHNLLITIDGVVKLADFGIAKIKGMSDATETGVLKGKLAYMSPEQATAGRIPITPATDLFSAGVVFWETATCERLFKATMEQELLVKVLNFNDASLPYYSSQFNMFLSGLLAHDPVNRFSSAEAALRALRKIGIQPCRKQDAAHLVQKIKTLHDNAEAMAAHQAAERTKGTVMDGIAASKETASSDFLVSPNDSTKRPRKWKRIAAAIGVVVLVCSLATWAFVTSKKEASAREIAPIEQTVTQPSSEKTPEPAPLELPIEPPAEAKPEPKPEAIPKPAPVITEEPKEEAPSIEEIPPPAPMVKKNKTESSKKKSKPKMKSDETNESGKNEPPNSPIPLEYEH
jgi:serine/threonine-protein kinase